MKAIFMTLVTTLFVTGLFANDCVKSSIDRDANTVAGISSSSGNSSSAKK